MHVLNQTNLLHVGIQTAFEKAKTDLVQKSIDLQQTRIEFVMFFTHKSEYATILC